MIKQTAIAIGLMTAAGAAFAAQAQTETGATADAAFGQSFAEVDVNGNGKISWEEAKANGISRSAFHSAETTQDGVLSKSEYQVAQAAKAGVVGEAVEVGKDTGAATEPMPETYTAMDANSDGRVSKEEFFGYYETSGIYDTWDANNNGMVDRQEFADAIFIIYDDNENNYVGKQEWQEGLT